MESQLSNALGLVKKYQKLAFLCHFENFLSFLDTAKKGHFRQSMDFLGLKSTKTSILRDDFKMPRTIRFLLFFAGNFTGHTLNKIFARPGGCTLFRLVFTPLRPTLVEVFPSDEAF